MATTNTSATPEPNQTPEANEPQQQSTTPTIQLNRNQLLTIGVIAGLFLLVGILTSLTMNRSDSPGARVAEAASRVGYQVDDTRRGIQRDQPTGLGSRSSSQHCLR